MKLLDLNVVNWNRLRIPSNEILADNRASNKTNASRHTISWIRLCGYYVNNFINEEMGNNYWRVLFRLVHLFLHELSQCQ
mmetsp:Transcript_15811/g.24392  ORF Transcript_15811/g.24392 Transcript_15811/m.24392 type:complete len:80 (+) Transcript_15811:388-627(+)